MNEGEFGVLRPDIQWLELWATMKQVEEDEHENDQTREEYGVDDAAFLSQGAWLESCDQWRRLGDLERDLSLGRTRRWTRLYARPDQCQG